MKINEVLKYELQYINKVDIEQLNEVTDGKHVTQLQTQARGMLRKFS